VTSKHLKHHLEKRTISGADIFWGVFSGTVVELNARGRSPSSWNSGDWKEFKEIISALLLRQADQIEASVSQQLQDRNERRTLRAGLDKQTEEARIELNRFCASAQRVPDEFRQAYWDNLLAWAKGQIDKPVSGISAPEGVWQSASRKELQEVKNYALADWVRTPSQELLLKLGNRLARGEFKQDPLQSNYPIADISGNQWVAHAEIRPLDFEREIGGMTVPSDVLEKAMNKLADTFKRSGVEVDNTSKIVLSLWDEKKDRDSWAYITLDDICRKLGLTERANHGGFEPRKRDAIREAVEKAARVSITVRDLPSSQGIKAKKMAAQDPFLLIKNRFTAQKELWDPNSSSKWDAIAVQPGAVTKYAIEEHGRLTMLLPKPLIALDYYRFRNTQLLGGRLTQLFRIKAKQGQKTYFLKVNTLLEYADLELNAETQDKLEKILYKLIETSTIGSWEYEEGFSIDGLVKERVTKRILEKYGEALVKLEVPVEVADHYNSIALNYDDKKKALPKINGIAEELKQARKFENLSLDELAVIIGVSKPSLSRIENGESVRTTTLAPVKAWLAARTQ
jgi:DNA-binding XRE family transcriptional regulator